MYNLVQRDLVRLLPYRLASMDIAFSAPAYIVIFLGVTELWAGNLQLIVAFFTFNQSLAF